MAVDLQGQVSCGANCLGEKSEINDTFSAQQIFQGLAFLQRTINWHLCNSHLEHVLASVLASVKMMYTVSGLRKPVMVVFIKWQMCLQTLSSKSLTRKVVNLNVFCKREGKALLYCREWKKKKERKTTEKQNKVLIDTFHLLAFPSSLVALCI